MTNKENADRLSRSLRVAYPGLTCARIKEIWDAVCSMKRGDITDLWTWEKLGWEKSDWIVATHLAVERTFRDRANYEKVIQRLSAHAKRRAFPRSYAKEST